MSEPAENPEFIPINRLKPGDDRPDPMEQNMKLLEEARQAWVARSLKRFMPGELYESLEAVRRGEKKPRNILLKGSRWMVQHKAVQRVYPDRTVLEIDGKVVAEFRVRFENGKCIAEERSWDLPDPTKN